MDWLLGLTELAFRDSLCTSLPTSSSSSTKIFFPDLKREEGLAAAAETTDRGACESSELCPESAGILRSRDRVSS